MLISRGKPTTSQSSTVPTASGASAFSEIRKTESARHETSGNGRRPKEWAAIGPLGKGSSMASAVLSRCARGQESTGDARPDRELHEAYRHMHEFLAELGHELRSPSGRDLQRSSGACTTRGRCRRRGNPSGD